MPIRNYRLLGIIAVFLLSCSAHAAQYGRAAAPFVKIHRDADTSTEVLIEVNKGQSIAISNESKNGWYKCLIPSVPGQPKPMEKFGWVQASDLVVAAAATSTPADPAKQTKKYVEPTQAFKRFSVYGFYGFHFIQPSALQKSVGVDSAFSISTGFGGQLGVRFTPAFMISALFEKHSFSRDILLPGDLTGKYYINGSLVGGLAQYDIVEVGNHRLGFAAGGGVSMSTKVGVSLDSLVLESAGFTMPVYLAKLVYRWNVGKPYQQLGFIVEAGYRIGTQKAAPIATSTVDVEISGPTAAAGLQYEF